MKTPKLSRSYVDDVMGNERTGRAPTVEGPATVWDEGLTGFGIRLRPTRSGKANRVSYVIRYSLGRRGTNKWLHIGVHGQPWRADPKTGLGRVLDADLARAEAIRLLGERVDGNDPAAMRDAERRMPFCKEFFERYYETYSKVHKGEDTLKKERWFLDERLIKELGEYRLDQLDIDTVRAWHASHAEFPSTANGGLKLLRAIYEQARLWKVLPKGHDNPCDGVKRFEENKRKRYVDPDEMSRLGGHIDAAGTEAGALFRLLLYTGARVGEVLKLKRGDVNERKGVAMIKRKCRGKDLLELHLPPRALAVLASLPVADEFYFPGAKAGRPRTVSSVQYKWHFVRKLAKLEDVRIHDLRHTYASYGTEQNVSIQKIGELLGQTEIATTQRYAHTMQEDQAKAALVISDRVGNILDFPTAAVAVPAPAATPSTDGRTTSARNAKTKATAPVLETPSARTKARKTKPRAKVLQTIARKDRPKVAAGGRR